MFASKKWIVAISPFYACYSVFCFHFRYFFSRLLRLSSLVLFPSPFYSLPFPPWFRIYFRQYMHTPTSNFSHEKIPACRCAFPMCRIYQIGIIHEYRMSQGRVTMYYYNLSGGPITEFKPDFPPVSEWCVCHCCVRSLISRRVSLSPRPRDGCLKSVIFWSWRTPTNSFFFLLSLKFWCDLIAASTTVLYCTVLYTVLVLIL